MTLTKQSLITQSVAIVTLEDFMGDDLAIVNAARVSFAKHSDWKSVCGSQPWHQSGTGDECDQCGCRNTRSIKDADVGLINYLMRERHGTPFEMVQFRFRISASIRVMREWQRHRIGSFNEVSTRYVEVEPRFFVPDDYDVRKQTGKPGHYVMEDAPELAADVKTEMLRAYDAAWESYQRLLATGVAKELAAYVLPIGLYSEQIWSVNLRSLFNFASLRTHTTALREIRRPAVIVESLARSVVPVAFEAFDAHGRVQP